VSINQLALHCPLLQTLEVRGLAKVTDQSVCSLAQRCNKLHDIDVRDCAMIGPKAVDTVNMLLPNCNILYLQGKAFTGH